MMFRSMAEEQAAADIKKHFEAGRGMRYMHRVSLLVFEWKNDEGLNRKRIWYLDNWFTPAAQDYVIDLIFPRI